MLNNMKTILLLLFVFLTIVAPQSYARLGDTEDAIISQHRNASYFHKDTFYAGDNRTFIISFYEPSGLFSAVFLDGKSVGEMWTRKDGTLPEAAIFGEMRSYSEVWEAYDTNSPDTAAARSADQRFYAIVGSPSPDIRPSFFIFTKELRDYHKQKTGKELKV
jgi:hypothetical protein